MGTGRTKAGRNFHMDGKITLLVVMIGFCILAIIEIVFGQARLKAEKDRLALEEQQYQAMQDLQLEEETLQETNPVLPETGEMQNEMTPDTANVPNMSDAPTIEPVGSGIEESDAVQDEEEDMTDCDMQIVFLGDSILDNTREYDGVATLIGQACNARVYNLAIGGTTAALGDTDNYDYNNWESSSLLGVVNAIVGNIDMNFFRDYKAGEIMKKCDFSQTDYFVIEYGVNDFLAKIPSSKYLDGGGSMNIQDFRTYGGALNIALVLLHDAFPDAKILVCAPHYCQIFSGDTFIGDGYSLDYGYGALVDYMRVCGYVAEMHKENGVIFYNAFEESGINAYTADQYLEDGIHLTSEGRHKYAELPIRVILADFWREE